MSEVLEVPAPPVDDTGSNNESSSRKRKMKLVPPEGGFTEWPDFDPKVYVSPRAGQFADPLVYWNYKRAEAMKVVEDIDKEIEIVKKFGADPEARKKAAQNQRMLKNITALAEGGELDTDQLAALMAVLSSLTPNS